jgi:hypothetical protein
MPGPVLHLAEIPGMTFLAGKVATGLIDGQVIFGAR